MTSPFVQGEANTWQGPGEFLKKNHLWYDLVSRHVKIYHPIAAYKQLTISPRLDRVPSSGRDEQRRCNERNYSDGKVRVSFGWT